MKKEHIDKATEAVTKTAVEIAKVEKARYSRSTLKTEKSEVFNKTASKS